MIILGIESSCDDTAASVLQNGRVVLSSVVASQESIHAKYGGVVPELASRRHIEAIVPVVEEALSSAGKALDDIDGIAVTQGPGLVGSLLIGLSFAKSLSLARGLPLTGVNHIEAHAHAAFLTDKEGEGEGPGFPFVALIVSGGHTTLLLFEDATEYKVLGQTLDDSAGEAFDKVAKLLGLGYPGGAAIDRLARDGDKGAVDFPRPLMAKGNLDFSFSGLKTSMLTYVKNLAGPPTEALLKDLSASFQEAVVDALVTKALWTLRATGAKDLVAAGGVASNSRFRARLAEMAEEEGLRLFIPSPRYCTDNAAMVASLGFHQLKKGMLAGLDMNAKPTWEGF
ncbi:MAG: tRNA (adenosine(37)-N6)-threonylcarbamoyltransferase complex transferase subunit TsaD [Deltaproteobacteria bacterium]|nr:tRNA (adenosine(37)-N6)-threonylcarbamoyltransferase complex transferase subunit TsaD [Deltaproteobacteria bacterium]MBZ0220209.1 tRNA (adenosine(37)-N6)-threonylcarbamoyltransferase complex transferase subunit TsaD [Deltaproteobacteria bacterium]